MSDYRQKTTDMMREWTTRELLEEVERFIDLDAPGYEDAECAMTVLYERSEPDDPEGLVEAERRVRTVGEYVIEKAAAGNADAEKVMAHRALRDRLQKGESGE